jgi:peptide/nickel transport system substrate-binding protein
LPSRERALPLLAAAVATLGLAACGGSSSSSSESKGDKAQTKAPAGAKKGGNLTVLYSADVDYIDPGATYYQYGFNVAYSTQRPLFSFKPDSTQAVPDLAAAPAKIASDGKSATITIRKGVKFSPPVNREVTAADVKYALERGFMIGTQNGYAVAYLGDLVGAPAKPVKPHPNIPGIQTQGKYTLVLKFKRARARIAVGALALPLSAPVPPEYAKKFDAKNPSQYGNNQVATGPYMIKNNSSGKAVGYQPNRQIQLVRNPNWDKATDYKPAYLNSITIKEGSDPTVASRTITNGKATVSGDFQLPTEFLRRGATGKLKGQFLVSPPTGRVRYVALNTKVPPFNNVNVRKAVIAGFDRTALRQAFGGPVTGEIATHYIPPGIAGFAQSGGAAGPKLDFLAHPTGDAALAKKYMQKAGYPSGKYTGSANVLLVSDNATQQKKVGEVVQNQLQKLGFKVTPRFVTRDTMFTAYCNVPAKKVQVCPSVGWLKDFPDPETMLFLTFKGQNIQPNNNSNWPQLDNPAVDSAMDKAGLLQDPTGRAKAWAKIDGQISALAPAVPWLWDKQPLLKSSDVNGVINTANASFDFGFTSVK